MKIVDHLVDPTLDGYHVYHRWMNLSFLWHTIRRRLIAGLLFWIVYSIFSTKRILNILYFSMKRIADNCFFIYEEDLPLLNILLFLYLFVLSYLLENYLWYIYIILLTYYVWSVFHMLQTLRILLHISIIYWAALVLKFVKSISIYIRNFKILWSRGGLYWLY